MAAAFHWCRRLAPFFAGRRWQCGLLLVWLVPGGLQSQAQGTTFRPDYQHNIIKINAPALLVSSLAVFYERSVGNQTSVVLGYGSLGQGFGFSSHVENGKYAFRRGTAEVRRYLSRQPGLQGLYVGPYLRLGQLQESSFVPDPPGQTVTGTWQLKKAVVWVPGVLVGYQLAGHKWFVVDAFVGLQGQIVAGELTGSNEVVQGFTTAVALRVGVTVGVPF